MANWWRRWVSILPSSLRIPATIPTNPEENHPLRHSRRLQGLPPEYGPVSPVRMATAGAGQSQQGDTVQPTYTPGVVYAARVPKSFHGDVFEDVDDWLEHFDRVAAVNEWDDCRKLRYVYFALEDYARTWFENRERSITSWPEFQRQLRETYSSPERKEKAEQALQTRFQKPNESVAMFVEDMSRLFRRADPDMAETKKVRLLMRGVKEQLFAGLMRNPPTTVAEFITEATTMERALQQRSLQYDRQSTIAAVSCVTCGHDAAALRELVRSVVREELEKVRTTTSQPAVTALGDIIREEFRAATQPLAPVRADVPLVTYAEALRSPQLPTGRRPPFTAPAMPRQYPASNGNTYEYVAPRQVTRKSNVWRTSDNRPLCYHCGEADHLYYQCPYRRLGLQGFPPNARRPINGERPREIEQYLATQQPFSPAYRRQSRSPSPRRITSPSRPSTFADIRNRTPSPRPRQEN